MLSLNYISTVRRGLGQFELENLLHTSGRNNNMLGLTGMLISDGVRFLHHLEGPEASVRLIFERIKKDDRHFAVTLLKETEITERQFGEWAMVYQHADNVSEFESFVDRVAMLTCGHGAFTSTHLAEFAHEPALAA